MLEQISVAEVSVPDLDPVVRVPFKLTRTDSVATAGSSFAQHIGKRVRKRGFGYYAAETPRTGSRII